MRSQSTADNPDTPRRERFATPLSVIGIFSAFMLVLVLLYPEQGLLGVLGASDDATTIRYREALLRMRPDDTELRFRVAGSLVRSGSPRRALELISGVPAGITAAQKHLLIELKYLALKSMFVQSDRGSAEWLRLKPLFASAAIELGGKSPPSWRLRDFANDARKAGDLELWQEYNRKFAAMETSEIAQPNDEAAKARIAGDYRRGAAICFEQMKLADSLSKRRKLFFCAVRKLQAGNLPKEAFEAGERNIGGLHSDRATLIFLTRVGLAAGLTARAERLVRRAMGMETVKSEAIAP
ncbi:MAG: hypothetical protein ACYDHC_02585 [Desulfuromonadaceae bacterium]